MILSIIAAASENRVIGKDNALIWHLPADLKRFKALTTGHTVLMGRKTFESMGRPLPNRRNVVLSGDLSFAPAGCEVVRSVEAAMERIAGDEEVFVIGGGHIYRTFWALADRLYLTLVRTTVEGDTFIPAIDPQQWREVKREEFRADEKNKFDYTYIDYLRP